MVAKNCVALVRVSSQQQTSFYKDNVQTCKVSLEMQEYEIRRWCKNNGVNLVKTFSIVGSGRNMEKFSEFNDMMKFVKGRKNFCVAVYAVDRFGRDLLSTTSHLNSLLRVGVHFMSVSENLYISASRTDEAMRFNQLMQTADMESTRIEKRVRSTNKFLRKYGWKFGNPPYGKRSEFIEIDRKDSTPLRVRKFVDDKYEMNIINFVKEKFLYLPQTSQQFVDMMNKKFPKGFRGKSFTVDFINRLKHH